MVTLAVCCHAPPFTCRYGVIAVGVHPPLDDELDELDELLLEDELELEEELVEVDVPPQAPKSVQDASLPGTVLVYQFAW